MSFPPSLSHRFYGLSESQWSALIRWAKIPDDRPELIRKRGWGPEANDWVSKRIGALMAVLPRIIELDDEDAEIFSDEIQRLQSISSGKLIFQAHQDVVLQPIAGNRVRLDVLTASGATFFQLYANIAGIQPRGFTQLPPPDVSVEHGSVQFSFGGASLLLSGISMVIACSAGLVASPFAVPGGLGLLTLGLIDQIINWRKTLIDTKAARATITKTELESRKLELEIREKELALKELELQERYSQPRPNGERQEEIRRQIEAARERLGRLETDSTPPSNLVPYEYVVQRAQEEGISPGLAHHVLNRSLPSFIPLKSYFHDVKVERSRQRQGGLRKASR